jgi:hypothetical protein
MGVLTVGARDCLIEYVRCILILLISSLFCVFAGSKTLEISSKISSVQCCCDEESVLMQKEVELSLVLIFHDDHSIQRPGMT